ncbi:GMC oxidoreductase [Zwartia vadi]|uniref:GMC oxidoreductase n=1 Tax=Zwartia vadi TaxID=3058168 RepID=UPI0025B34748|nr:GMC family oxidoreductase [Zwartia vadi]MDN3987934.1 GMC family oxidoreductase [Zwartia vadi]
MSDVLNHEANFDVCVVGTGAGGGILAHQLAKAGLKVVSLEQGPLLPSDQFKTVMPPGLGTTFGISPTTVWPSDPHDSLFIHPLFARKDEGSTDLPQDGFRHFQILAVNGLQNLWNGVSVRFSSEDLSSWPLHTRDLSHHYSAVEKLITVCGTREGIDALPDGEFIEPKPLRRADHLVVEAVQSLGDPHSHAIPNRKAINTRAGTPGACESTGVCTSGCPVGSVYKFSSRLLPELKDLPNYQLISSAKVVKLLRYADSNSIYAVQYLDTRTGQHHQIRAKKFVLATGAVETPRILFNSADTLAPTGMGNIFGQLGQGLQDNPKVVLSTSLRKLWGNGPEPDIGYGDLLILMSRGMTSDGQSFPFIGHAIHGIPDYPHYLDQMPKLPAKLKEYLARKLFHSYVTLGLFCAGERIAANRVRPADTFDRYGVRQVAIDFTIPDRARMQMDAMMDWGRRVLRRASSTLVYTSRDNNGTGIHYAGTTALSDKPESGVVDENLKVFGYDNLYICDGGVIPTLPDKHLTLTIMALAHRLGERLAGGSS